MPSNQVLEHVAANLRRLRDGQGLSQQALADAAGVSRRTIAGLEAGDANISLAKLSLIATALGANFTALVSPAGRAPDQAPDVLTWRGQLAGSQAVLHCSAAASHQVELWSWTLAPGERYHAEADPEGCVEMLYVIEGALTLELAGQERVIPAGATTSFASSVSYAYANRQAGVLRFIRNLVI